VLFLLFGASASGKSYTLAELRGRVPRLALYDFDGLGMPEDGPPARSWRHATTEVWVQRAIEHQREGIDTLLAGQVPYGELLAAPSTPLLDGVAGCLLDCREETRAARLQARGVDWLERAGGSFDDHMAWAEWMRGHAADPGHRQHVITDGCDLAFDRWAGWPAGDPRWRIAGVSTDQPVAEVGREVIAWIEGERRGRSMITRRSTAG
jgi:hypothetical protein